MPMTYNEYLIALEAELVSITDEKEEKIKAVKEKIADAIKTAWDKFCEFVQKCSNTLKGVLAKFKSKGGKAIAISNEDVSKIEGTIKLFKKHSEEYKLIVKELKKSKRDKLASLIIGILASISAATAAGIIFIEKTGEQNLTFDDKLSIGTVNAEGSVYKFANQHLKGDLPYTDDDIDYYTSLNKADVVFNRGIGMIENSPTTSLKFLGTYFGAGTVAGVITKILTNSKETKEKIKILKNIVKNENLTNDELQQINRLLNLQRHITSAQLNAILNAKYIIEKSEN